MKNNKWKFHLPFLKKEVGGLSSPKCWCLIGKINLGETIDIDHLVQFLELDWEDKFGGNYRHWPFSSESHYFLSVGTPFVFWVLLRIF
jgi:hypothetical protein